MLKDILKQLDDSSPEKRREAKASLTSLLKNIEVVKFSCQIIIGYDEKEKPKILKIDKALLAVNTAMDVLQQIDTHVIVEFKALKFIKHPIIND